MRPRKCLALIAEHFLLGVIPSSPNQVLTHAARAAAKPFQPPLVAARGARRALVRANPQIKRETSRTRRAGADRSPVIRHNFAVRTRRAARPPDERFHLTMLPGAYARHAACGCFAFSGTSGGYLDGRCASRIFRNSARRLKLCVIHNARAVRIVVIYVCHLRAARAVFGACVLPCFLRNKPAASCHFIRLLSMNIVLQSVCLGSMACKSDSRSPELRCWCCIDRTLVIRHLSLQFFEFDN